MAMNKKRFNALERIHHEVVVDLNKWSPNERIGDAYYELHFFARWLQHVLDVHREHDVTFPLPYYGRTKLNPFINAHRRKWKYLIDFKETLLNAI